MYEPEYNTNGMISDDYIKRVEAEIQVKDAQIAVVVKRRKELRDQIAFLKDNDEDDLTDSDDEDSTNGHEEVDLTNSDETRAPPGVVDLMNNDEDDSTDSDDEDSTNRHEEVDLMNNDEGDLTDSDDEDSTNGHEEVDLTNSDETRAPPGVVDLMNNDEDDSTDSDDEARLSGGAPRQRANGRSARNETKVGGMAYDRIRGDSQARRRPTKEELKARIARSVEAIGMKTAWLRDDEARHRRLIEEPYARGKRRTTYTPQQRREIQESLRRSERRLDKAELAASRYFAV